MTTDQNEKLRQAVAMGQWSVSGVVVIAVMVLITGVPVPDWLAAAGTWYAVTVGPVALIMGMYLVWAIPGWDVRKWIVVAVEVYVLFCGVGLFHYQVDRAKADEGNATREAFLAGAEYRTALDAYEGAKKEWEAQAARIQLIPGDFTTGARQTTEASQKAKADFDKASADFIAVDAKAPKLADPVSSAGVFRIFGKENEGWVLALVLFLLGLSYEAVALALSWRPEENPKPSRVKKEEPSQPVPASQPVKIPNQKTAEDYIRAAKQGRTDGRVSGRETVMQILNIPEREARRLYAECIEKGYIIPAANQTQKSGEAPPS